MNTNVVIKVLQLKKGLKLVQEIEIFFHIFKMCRYFNFEKRKIVPRRWQSSIITYICHQFTLLGHFVEAVDAVWVFVLNLDFKQNKKLSKNFLCFRKRSILHQKQFWILSLNEFMYFHKLWIIRSLWLKDLSLSFLIWFKTKY